MKTNLNEMADSAGRQVGDRVVYTGAWGTEPAQECTITSVGENKGRLVYDNDLGRWGYANQYTNLEAETCSQS